ncbi:hypothetical protein Tco_0128173 [Tanacetum coccineum]
MKEPMSVKEMLGQISNISWKISSHTKDLLQRMLDLGLEVERESSIALDFGLEVERESSIALDLIRFIKQQIDEE